MKIQGKTTILLAQRIGSVTFLTPLHCHYFTATIALLLHCHYLTATICCNMYQPDHMPSSKFILFFFLSA